MGFRGDGGGGVPAQPRFPFIEGQASAHVETAKQLPKHATSGLWSVQVEVIVGDDEPAQIFGFFQLPNLIFQLENLFLTGRLKRIAFWRHFGSRAGRGPAFDGHADHQHAVAQQSRILSTVKREHG